jgi:transposase
MEYGAIDLHARHTLIRIVTAEGTAVLDRRVTTTREALTAVFGGRPRARILIESGTESEWVAQTIEACGHDVLVVAPSYALMYGHRDPQIKTDRRDVIALAEACRLGIYKRAHRVSAEQRARRRALRVRTHLVRLRAQTINQVRMQLGQEGYRLRSCSSGAMAQHYAALPLAAALRAVLAPLVAVIESLTAQIRACETELRAIAATDSIVTMLRTAPGVGLITGLTYRAVLDDVGRFASAQGVSAYLGLVPREDSSGARQRKGAITKAGSSELRVLLVQASWAIWRQRRPSALHTWVHRVAARRGKRIAVVGLARRLARILYAMWRDGRSYCAAPVPV